MHTHKIGIIMNGVTGRMGTNQHLMRSLHAIIQQGGLRLDNGDLILPEPYPRRAQCRQTEPPGGTGAKSPAGQLIWTARLPIPRIRSISMRS